MHASKYRIEEARKRMPVRGSKEYKRANESTNDRENGQYNQWNRHYTGNLMNVLLLHLMFGMPDIFLVVVTGGHKGPHLTPHYSRPYRASPTIGSCKNAKDQTEHIEGRQTCCYNADTPEQV